MKAGRWMRVGYMQDICMGDGCVYCIHIMCRFGMWKWILFVVWIRLWRRYSDFWWEWKEREWVWVALDYYWSLTDTGFCSAKCQLALQWSVSVRPSLHAVSAVQCAALYLQYSSGTNANGVCVIVKGEGGKGSPFSLRRPARRKEARRLDKGPYTTPHAA